MIELSDPQYEFLTSAKKHTGFVAGFGSGKSFIGTLKALMKIIENGIPKVAYYLPTYGDIRDIAFDGFPTVCDMLGYDFKLNKSDKELRLYDNGKEIGMVMFRNMSEPESIVGYQVGYSLLDETDILPLEKMDKAFKKILGRNRLVVPVKDEDLIQEYKDTGIVPEGTYLHQETELLCWINSIDVAGTPEGFKWFYTRFDENFKPDSDMLVRASTYSNLHNLPDDFIETMRQEYTEELFNAYVNGLFVNLTTGSIFSYFDREKHHSDEVLNDYEELIIGQDFNIGACISIVYVRRGDKIIAVDEYSSYDTRGVIENTKERYPNRVYYFYPDASGNNRKTNASETDIQMLQSEGFTVFVNSQNPAVKDRINITNNLFDKGRLLVNTKKCPSLTKALEQHSYDEKGDPEKFATAGSVDDYTDACFSGDTKVIINNKEMMFRDIPESGVITGYDGKEVEYINGGLIRYDNLCTIKLQDGTIIKATPIHKFLTLDGWVEAQHLKGRILCNTKLYQKISKSLESGINQIKAESGIKNTTKKCNTSLELLRSSNVKLVEKNMRECLIQEQEINTVQINAVQRREEIAELITKLELALCVEKHLSATNIKQSKHVQEVVDVSLESKIEPTYCVTVPKDACFALANGCIVSNCTYPLAYLFPIVAPISRVKMTGH